MANIKCQDCPRYINVDADFAKKPLPEVIWCPECLKKKRAADAKTRLTPPSTTR